MLHLSLFLEGKVLYDDQPANPQKECDNPDCLCNVKRENDGPRDSDDGDVDDAGGGNNLLKY